MKVILCIFLTNLCFWWGLTLERNLFEGDNCQVAGEPGKCTIAQKCPAIIDPIHNNPSLVKICGYKGLHAIVCCPSGSQLNLKTPEDSDEDMSLRFGKRRKSEKVCRTFTRKLSKRSIVDFNILGGENAGYSEFPHMAALGYETSDGLSWDCGATVISDRFLLTAAHCFLKSVKPTVARLGMTLLNGRFHKDIRIKKDKQHPLYDKDTKHHDIALVELSENIRFSKRIRPACLFTSDTDPRELIITGWGITRSGRNNRLQKAEMIPIPVRSCNETYVRRSAGIKTITRKQICAWGMAKRDACNGDSGGPLQIKQKNGMFSVVGVVSYGGGCGGQAPGVYTRVSGYLDWIEGIVWK